MPHTSREAENEYRRTIREERRSRGVCYKCGVNAAPRGSMCADCRGRVAKNAAKQRSRQKDIVFDHYGRFCACCGEDEQMFLEVDHINNDGYADRKKNGPYIYGRIIKQGFPDTFQILCANCNKGKHRNGGVCPHKSQ